MQIINFYSKIEEHMSMCSYNNNNNNNNNNNIIIIIDRVRREISSSPIRP